MKKFFKKLFITFTLLIFIVLIIVSITGGIIFYKASNAYIYLKQGYEPIEFYDENKNLVATDSCYYSYTPYMDISKNITNAFVAVEDRKFFSHQGYDIARIMKSIYINLKHEATTGASTITQQYVKNAFLSNEKTILRKLNEIALSMEIEKKYTKEQIFEAYLNTILFGSNIFGIKMACEYYFSKEPKNISISEGAYLAGMIQAPNYYNAYRNPEAANERKNIVLKCLFEEGYITEQEYHQELQVKIENNLKKKINTKQDGYLVPYLDYIYQNMEDSENTIKQVYTYLDIDMQKEVYKIMTNGYQLFNDDEINCAIVVIDNETYGVKAIMGNRSGDAKVLNYASEVLLQPGSTIKPILDYAPAIEYLSLTLASIIEDEPYTYQNGTEIKNYDNNYLGPITLRKALSDSRNIPAVKLFNMVGYDRAFSFANKIGIYNDEYYEADAIGGAKNGYTLLSLANAYTAFANLGYYKKATGIEKTVYDTFSISNNALPTLAMKPTTAWLINNVLHDVFKNSTYDLKNTYLMAKTGQTNYDTETRTKFNIPYGATKDSLLIGYTKDLTIGVWVGYGKVSQNTYLDRYKKNIPRSIMKILLSRFAKDNQYYSMLDDIEKSYITIHDDEAYLSLDSGYFEYFEKGTSPMTYAKEAIRT